MVKYTITIVEDVAVQTGCEILRKHFVPVLLCTLDAKVATEDVTIQVYWTKNIPGKGKGWRKSLS